MRTFAALSLFALLTVCPWLARAQVGALEGTVRDANTNKPVAGAQVQLKIPNAPKISVVPDANGHFIFNALPAGKGFSLRVTRSNYEDWKGGCPTINSGSRVSKEIALTPGAGGGAAAAAAAGGGGGGGADGTVTGVVTSGGKPLAGVSIKIGKNATTSAGNGSYTVKVPAGSYTVVAKKDGYKKSEGSVTVAPGISISHNIELSPKK